MKPYEVHLSLLMTSVDDHTPHEVADALAEALADADEQDSSLLDWSLGLDAGALLIDIDMTVEADHHANAVSHAHDLVRSATTQVHATTSATFTDADNDIRVFA